MPAIQPQRRTELSEPGTIWSAHQRQRLRSGRVALGAAEIHSPRVVEEAAGGLRTFLQRPDTEEVLWAAAGKLSARKMWTWLAHPHRPY